MHGIILTQPYSTHGMQCRVQAYNTLYIHYVYTLHCGLNNKRETIGITGDYWRLLEFTGGYWRLLEITGGYWRLLEITGDYWRLLEVTGDYWRLLEILEITRDY